ncbi:MAG: ornithine carbamoyltransferase [Acidobacteria bacterium OLB17]|nr:MAG: ornithine carbamoyltransferase [Acidobacteria bacterium OLB17]MCZ2392100.1 N-acetylornithine carbamoyltransferase [Acidobacteriota bacterium]
MNHFLSTAELSRDDLGSLLRSAAQYKAGRRQTGELAGRSVALVFLNPSLRTRASMQIAVYELGGNPVLIEPGATSWSIEYRENVVMDSDKTEHLAEFVRVLSRYVSAIGVRTFAEMKNWELERTDPVLSAFARYATVPVINLESAMHHPCQSLADMLTIRERYGEERKRVLLTWAWHPKALPMAVPNSFALAAAQCGHDLVIAHPDGYGLDPELMHAIGTHAELNGGSVEVVNDPEKGFEGADVVYAKSWAPPPFYGRPDAVHSAEQRDKWIVNADKMALTANGVFLHCLPVRRNVIATDEVLDSPNSLIIDEAENRLHVQKAILASLVK